ncbi:MAG: hypothetical protein IKV25_00995 [Clostridia bacterium]|nr:hypothetical protein [Clostridia bacterium]
MKSKKYRFFDTVIQIITPEEIPNEQPFVQFLCDDEPTNTVTFKYVTELPEVDEKTVSGEEVAFKAEGEKSFCWYKHHGKEGYFACRICDGEVVCVQVLEEYRGKLWDGIIFNLSGFEEIISENNGVVLHASVVMKDDKMILFTAPCGVGKSTQADLWKIFADAETINGDKALITFDKDIAMVGGLPFSGSSNICKNKSAPLQAIVCLGQAEKNTLRIMDRSEAFISLMQGNYRYGMREKASRKTVEVIEKICNSTPVYKFDCLPDKTAVECLRKELGI